MNFEVKDLTGLGEPLKKLIEAFQATCGCLYLPKAMRKQADAKAYEIKTLARAQAEAEVEVERIRMVGHTDGATDSPGEPLILRAKQRLLTRELQGQQNLENIVDRAAEELPATVSSEAINNDWRRKFFMEAENVCEADMQLIWGKLLAGELASPGAFSTRTLDVLRNLSSHEAETFRQLCTFAMHEGFVIPTKRAGSAEYPGLPGLKYGDLLQLRDAGLVMEGDTITRQYKNPESSTSVVAYLKNNGLMLAISAEKSSLAIPAILFTTAGRELQRLIDGTPNEEYLKSLGECIRNSGNIAKRGESLPGNDSLVSFDADL